MTDKKKTSNEASQNGERSLTQMAYRKIKEMMLNYEIIPGQRLVFVDLAKKIGVSRTPVNHALSILASEGFLDFIPHQGYTVHELTQEEANALNHVREIIELGAIELAIQKLTPEKTRDPQKTERGLVEEAECGSCHQREFRPRSGIPRLLHRDGWKPLSHRLFP